MSEPLRRSLREALLSLVAMLATLACTQWLEPGPASGVLGAVLSLSLARSHLADARRGTREALVALPLVALVCVGIGALLHLAPWPGALVFVAAMAVSIWVRRFGARAARLGTLLALPLMTILVVPQLPQRAGVLPPSIVPVAVGLLALAFVLLVQALGRRLGWIEPADGAGDVAPVPAASAMRPSPHARMALQMAVALGAAFAIGYLVFAPHWRWIVLTAYIVNSGNRGRQDVVYKSVLRVLGAAAGSVAAVGLAGLVPQAGPGLAAWILASVFLGVWLRPAGYGWWALFLTLALALLQAFEPAAGPLLLWQRLLEIVLGAAIGVAAAWFVLPVRSTDVLRKRIAEALAAIADALDPQAAERRADRVVAAIRRVEQLRPSFRARHLALRRWQPLQPHDWIALLADCEAPVLALVQRAETPGAVRKAVGAARQAMREPARIAPALAALRQALASAGATVAR